MEDWDKDSHWHFFIPTGPGGQGCQKDYIHFKFPKIWEIGAIATMAERSAITAADKLIDGTDVDAGEFAHQMGRIAIQQLKLDIVPFAVEPIFEQMINRNRFTDRPIETYAMTQREPGTRFRGSTPRVLQEAGLATLNLPPHLQISPVRLESLIRGYANTWGLYGLMLADWAVYRKELPDRDITRTPGLRRFMGTHPGQTKYNSEFWDMINSSMQVSNSINFLREQTEDRVKLAEDKAQSPERSTGDMLKSAYNKINRMNREIQRVYLADDMTSTEKKTELDRLKTEKNILLKGAVMQVKESQ